MASTTSIRAGRAFVELFADDSRLVRGLRAAEKRLKAFGGRIRNLGARVAGLGAAAVAPLLAASKVFAATGDGVAKMAKRTGLSVEALSELQFAAGQSGVGVSELENGVRRMQRTIYDAERGLSTATDALADLGLSAGSLQGLKPEDQFKLLADRISGVEDPTRRAALAMTIFGRSGTQLLPMFERGARGIEELQAEARRLGLTMSTEDAEAAEVFGDAMDRLWSVIRMGVFRVGAALAPLLQTLTDRMTAVAVAISGWIDTNRQLVVTVAKVAAAVVAGGLALVALGVLIAGLGSVFGVLASVVTTVGGVLGALAGAVGLLISPIGLTIAAVVALGAYLVHATDAGGKAIAWLGERFAALRDTALASFGGIADALAAGDLSLAVRVLWLSIRMEWTRGVNDLEGAWLGFRGFFIRIGYDAWHGLLAVAETVWHALEVGWIETTAFFARMWQGFTGFFARTWENIKAGAQKAWNWIRSLFDDSIDLQAENRLVEQQRDAAVARIADEQQRNLAERESRRESQRQRAEAVHRGTLGEIGRQNLDANQQLDDEMAQRMAQNEAELAEARRQWQEALAEARQRREASEAGAPGGADGPDGLLDRARLALEGVGDTLSDQVERMTTRGTFNAAAAVGLQSGGVTERMASGIDRIERNTRPLRNAEGLAFE